MDKGIKRCGGCLHFEREAGCLHGSIKDKRLSLSEACGLYRDHLGPKGAETPVFVLDLVTQFADFVSERCTVGKVESLDLATGFAGRVLERWGGQIIYVPLPRPAMSAEV